MADAAYLGRLWNLLLPVLTQMVKSTKIRNFLSQEIIINRQIGYAEKLFTPIGMLLGVSLGIFCLSLHASYSFLGCVFLFFVYFVYFRLCLHLGGLFNRLASSFMGHA